MKIPDESPSDENPRHDVYRKVLQRLKESIYKEATLLPDFEDNLWQHFSRLPARYALWVKTLEKAEDVLTHLHLLKLIVEDPAIRIVLEVTSSIPPTEIVAVDSAVVNRPMHNITFVSTVHKPNVVFSQLTSLVGELGLNIQEASSFSSADGLSLHIFVVDGWSQQETQGLKDALTNEILKLESNKIIRKSVFSKRSSKPPDSSNWKPNRASVSDSPLESLRKHLVVTASERIYRRLHKLAEKNESFGSKVVGFASFSQRSKAMLMNRMLLNHPCEYTHKRSYNNKRASLSIAKTTATVSVAALFGLYALGTGFIPAMKDNKDNYKKMEDLTQSFDLKLGELHLSVKDRLEEMKKKSGELQDSFEEQQKTLLLLEEQAAVN